MNLSIRWTYIVFFIWVIYSSVSQSAHAQESFHPSLYASLFLGEEFPAAPPDSIPVSVVRRPRLLPENLGFFERNLWTENGLFRTMGIAAPLTPESRKSELQLRRTMLVAHQTSGFVTLGLMMTTAYYGQRVIDNGDRLISLRRTHVGFADATIATYSLTALLSLLSPPPIIRRDEISTLSFHRALAWIHVTGIIITPIIASLAKHRGANNISILHIHQVSGYITTTAFAASMIVITF